MTECEWCHHEVEEVEFIENYMFNGHVCEECRTHEIKSQSHEAKRYNESIQK